MSDELTADELGEMTIRERDILIRQVHESEVGNPMVPDAPFPSVRKALGAFRTADFMRGWNSALEIVNKGGHPSPYTNLAMIDDDEDHHDR